MTVKSAVNDMELDVHTLSKKKVVGDCPTWWSKTRPRQWLNWQQIQRKAKKKYIGVHCSAEYLKHTVGYGATQQMTHSCVSADQASSPTTLMLSPGTSRLDYALVEENCLVRWIRIFSFIIWRLCQGMPSSRRMVVPSMRFRLYTSRWWRYYGLGDVLLDVSGIRDCGRGRPARY